MSHRVRRQDLLYFNHDPSGPYVQRPIIDHAAIGGAQVANSVTINGPVPISGAVGGTWQLTASAFDASGAAINSPTALWSSSNASVASVSSSGLVTFVSPGTATITASVDARSYSITATTTANVNWSQYNFIPIGDSITHGNNAAIPVNDWVTRLTAALTGLGATMTAAPGGGYVGGTASTAISNFTNDTLPKIAAGKINVPLVWFGQNDLNNVPNGSLRELQAYYGANAQLWELLVANGTTAPIVASPEDRNDTTASNAGYRTSQPMIDSWLRENRPTLMALGKISELCDIAADYELGSIGAVDSTTPYGDNTITNYGSSAIFAADKIHPNHYGHYLIANSWLGAIYRYLGLKRPSIKPNNLVMVFEPWMAQKGIGTYLPELMPPQYVPFSTTAPAVPYAYWDTAQHRISFGFMDQPFRNAGGFTLVMQADMSKVDLASQCQYFGSTIQNSALFQFGVRNAGKPFFTLYYDPTSTANYESVDYTGTALTYGMHTVAISYNPSAARGSRFNMVVDGGAPSFTESQAGTDGANGVPAAITSWGDDVVLGTDRFPSYTAPSRVRHNVLMWNTPLSTADMQSACTYLANRWPISAGW